jgi:ABC-2 type transport system ATP-binding protein
VAVLEARAVSKWYGDVIAVNDVTLDVLPGVTGLLGPNGAGKSTLMKMAMGLAEPSQGELLVLGEKPWSNPKLLSRVGFVPEGDAPWREHTGTEVAILSGELGGLSRQAAKEAAEHALRQVGLSGVAEKRVETYSRGMRQKLKLALALLNEPELLILDEPLLGSDPLARRDLIQLIRSLASSGKSIIVSTHVLPDVEAMTDRIMLMNHGRLMAHGRIDEVRDLLDRYPRTVRIATTNAVELGALLWGWDTVLSLQREEGAVVVKTKRPKEFHAELQNLLMAKRLPFTSVTSLDDNVEAIFQYLVS